MQSNSNPPKNSRVSFLVQCSNGAERFKFGLVTSFYSSRSRFEIGYFTKSKIKLKSHWNEFKVRFLASQFYLRVHWEFVDKILLGVFAQVSQRFSALVKRNSPLKLVVSQMSLRFTWKTFNDSVELQILFGFDVGVNDRVCTWCCLCRLRCIVHNFQIRRRLAF